MERRVSVLVTARRGGTVVALDGEAVRSVAAEIEGALSAQMGSRRVVIDLSAVESIAPADTQVLLGLQTTLLTRGGTLALACPQPPVGLMLAQNGTDQLIPVYDSVPEALSGRLALRVTC